MKAILAPCHTKGHLLYSLEGSQGEPNVLFTGDTLFVGGCGKFFEGTADDMHVIMTNLSKLNKDTQIFCGHEYTVKNLQFAAMLEPKNKELNNKLQWAIEQRHRKQPTIPSTIGEELEYNPFMRCNLEIVASSVNLSAANPVTVLNAIRTRKNTWKNVK